MTPIATLKADEWVSATEDFTTVFSPVPSSAVRFLDDFACDLYIVREGDDAPVLYREKSYEEDESKSRLLKDCTYKTFYVKAADYRSYQKKLESQLERLLQSDDISTADRFSILQSALADRFEHAFRLINSGRAIQESQSIGTKIASTLQNNDTLPMDLISVAKHDFDTFTHTTNVSGYCVLLALKLGINAPDELNEIAIGGMLHDLGKRSIPRSVLNKEGRLTRAEKRTVQTHPQRGYEDLHDRSDLNFGQRMMVYQHHERIDGTGYPVRIVGRDIHPWAKLCAVVDVFEALTSRRPYRPCLSITEALEYLESAAGSHLDKEIVRCWTSAVAAK